MGNSGRRRPGPRSDQGPGARRPPRRAGESTSGRSRRVLLATRRQRVARSRRRARRPRLGGQGRRCGQAMCFRSPSLAWNGPAARATCSISSRSTSLRGNPFEVRGRITSSSQFWNRERLVSLSPRRDARGSLERGDRAPSVRQVIASSARSHVASPGSRHMSTWPGSITRSRSGKIRRSRSTRSCDPSALVSSIRRARAIHEPPSRRLPRAKSTPRRSRASCANCVRLVLLLRRGAARRRCCSYSTSSSRPSVWRLRLARARRSTSSRSCSDDSATPSARARRRAVQPRSACSCAARSTRCSGRPSEPSGSSQSWAPFPLSACRASRPRPRPR